MHLGLSPVCLRAGLPVYAAMLVSVLGFLVTGQGQGLPRKAMAGLGCTLNCSQQSRSLR